MSSTEQATAWPSAHAWRATAPRYGTMEPGVIARRSRTPAFLICIDGEAIWRGYMDVGTVHGSH
ncbi:hypothetical protein AZ78_3718 [Lysobacter capsici AZ78]|uniref:Uncharacterized protein n=1 Tax=Lysobacter capsici AZ78 TaxID=1444315 RepID=A0A108UBL9_9GAMM|nr:hypothetical protein AZ78_3718 [Lysobacter capsici AZ78]